MDFHELERTFFISRHNRDDAVFSMTAEELADPVNMKRLLDAYAPLIRALEPAAAAAYFCGWLGGPALALQYLMSAANTALDLSLANITVQLHPENRYHRFSFRINRWVEQRAPEGEAERTAWRNSSLAGFYGGTVRPLVEAASSASGTPLGLLWGQIPTRFFYFMDRMLAETDQPMIRQRWIDDYRYLCKELDAFLFGLKKNPFDVKVRMIEDLQDSGKQIPMKNACCLYYRTEGGEYCYACPRLKEEERAARRAKFRTGQEMAKP